MSIIEHDPIFILLSNLEKTLIDIKGNELYNGRKYHLYSEFLDNKTVLNPLVNGGIALFNISDGKLIEEINIKKNFRTYSQYEIEAFVGRKELHFRQTNNRDIYLSLVGAYGDMEIYKYNRNDRDERKMIQIYKEKIGARSFDQTIALKYLIVDTVDGYISIYDIEKIKMINKFKTKYDKNVVFNNDIFLWKDTKNIRQYAIYGLKENKIKKEFSISIDNKTNDAFIIIKHNYYKGEYLIFNNNQTTIEYYDTKLNKNLVGTTLDLNINIITYLGEFKFLIILDDNNLVIYDYIKDSKRFLDLQANDKEISLIYPGKFLIDHYVVNLENDENIEIPAKGELTVFPFILSEQIETMTDKLKINYIPRNIKKIIASLL